MDVKKSQSGASTSDKYAIVTPVRDEEEFIEKLILSVVKKALRRVR